MHTSYCGQQALHAIMQKILLLRVFFALVATCGLRVEGQVVTNGSDSLCDGLVLTRGGYNCIEYVVSHCKL